MAADARAEAVSTASMVLMRSSVERWR